MLLIVFIRPSQGFIQFMHSNSTMEAAHYIIQNPTFMVSRSRARMLIRWNQAIKKILSVYQLIPRILNEWKRIQT